MPCTITEYGDEDCTLLAHWEHQERSLCSDSATEGCDERCPSVLLDLGVGEKAEEIRMTF